MREKSSLLLSYRLKNIRSCLRHGIFMFKISYEHLLYFNGDTAPGLKGQRGVNNN